MARAMLDFPEPLMPAIRTMVLRSNSALIRRRRNCGCGFSLFYAVFTVMGFNCRNRERRDFRAVREVACGYFWRPGSSAGADRNAYSTREIKTAHRPAMRAMR